MGNLNNAPRIEQSYFSMIGKGVSPRILSIQSHTVHGFVGNKAATYPLQLLGYDVNAINTVSLSNHPAYPKRCKGHSLAPSDFQAVIQGLDENNLLGYSSILSGYCVSAELLQIIEDTIILARKTNANTLYFLDPVLGDNGQFYVPKELADVYKNKLLPIASVITPNHFEAEILSSTPIRSLTDVLTVCEVFHTYGVKIYIQKGLDLGDSSKLNVIASVVTNKNKIISYRKEFPRINRRFSGCGDLFTALITAFITKYYENIVTEEKHNILANILDIAVSAMTSVLLITEQLDKSELAIIESSDILFPMRNIDLTSSTAIKQIGSPAHLMRGDVVGVIFDMDGTLTEHGSIDFQAMYDRIGIKRSPGVDILTVVENMESPIDRANAYKIIEDEELKGCENMLLREHVSEVLSMIDSFKIRIAISTRNSKQSVHKFIDKLPSNMREVFSHIISRESVGGVNKPDPRVAWHIMNEWGYLKNYDGTAPSSNDCLKSLACFGDVWFVGDSIDDMKCGRSAGCKTCLINTNTNVGISEELVDLRVDSLQSFVELVLKVKV